MQHLENKLWHEFCDFMYVENCVERHNEQRPIYESKFKYIRDNYSFLKKEWKQCRHIWLARAEIS
jgi:hypothetical protein